MADSYHKDKRSERVLLRRLLRRGPAENLRPGGPHKQADRDDHDWKRELREEWWEMDEWDQDYAEGHGIE